ncbi:hypothetical protein [Galbibacter sp. PAP.153]|uniref:hypothetical protein n=1 Tax=Galbibacter sp. PAP.153 TaxID=3104623 RepID=UPI003008245B
MKNKKELENDFEWWITCIPDKIERLEELIPPSIFSQLDYSLQSLNILGNYIIEKIQTVSNLKNEQELWDCIASYVGTCYRRNVPTAKWRVELEDKNNLFYGVPALRTDAMTNFYPKYEITTMLDRKRADFLYAITKKHNELQRDSI